MTKALQAVEGDATGWANRCAVEDLQVAMRVKALRAGKSPVDNRAHRSAQFIAGPPL
jgi:hypothetical protein